VPTLMPHPSGPAEDFAPAHGDPTINMSAIEQERYAALRDWRNQESKKTNIPSFLIFSNGVLAALAAENPQNLDEIAELRGMGPKRVSSYGKAILVVLRQLEQR
jgi:superfamily II DNA helicase RecQ